MRRAIAVILMLPGLVLLGFLSWQYVGTNISASGSQDTVRESITKSLEAQDSKSEPVYPWQKSKPVKRDTTSKPVVKPKKIKVDDRFVEFVGLLSIPAIGVKNEPVVDSFTQQILDAGIIASMGAKPGTIGNFVVIGHVVGHGEVFRDLKKLRKGDTVTVKTATGTFTYRIRGGPVTIKDTDTEVLRGSSKKIISLITCAEVFHTDKRIAVFGDLVKRTP